jgi:hypothetical protein
MRWRRSSSGSHCGRRRSSGSHHDRRRQRWRRSSRGSQSTVMSITKGTHTQSVAWHRTSLAPHGRNKGRRLGGGVELRRRIVRRTTRPGRLANISPATWWSPRDEEGVSLEVDVNAVVTILNGPVEQQRIVARDVVHAPVKPINLETKRARTKSVEDSIRVGMCIDVWQVDYSPRLLKFRSKMRDQELLGGNNICRDRKTTRLQERSI